MASTNKTANLHLNQWEPGDPVLREDFNADNARLDETIALVKLKEAYTEENANVLSLDLSDVPTERFLGLKAHLIMPGDSALTGSSYYNLTLNGVSRASTYASVRLGSNVSYGDQQVNIGAVGASAAECSTAELDLHLMPGNLQGLIYCLNSGEGTNVLTFRVRDSSISRDTLASIDLFIIRNNVGRVTLPTGAGIILYGLLK